MDMVKDVLDTCDLISDFAKTGKLRIACVGCTYTLVGKAPHRHIAEYTPSRHGGPAMLTGCIWECKGDLEDSIRAQKETADILDNL